MVPDLIIPDFLIEPFCASVKMVRSVIDRQMILLSVKGKLSVFDPVRRPS